MSERTLSERMMDGRAAENEIEDGMIEAGLEDWDRIGCDWYDNSIEVYGVRPEHPMPVTAAKFLLDECGFSKVYANQTDGWEVHFSHNSPNGWHRRWCVDSTSKHNRVLLGEPDFGYWEVSEFPDSWPAEWLENGYVKVVGRPQPSSAEHPHDPS